MNISLWYLYTTDVIISVWLCVCDVLQLLLFVFTSRTLSNWVYELDKWAPSVVKIAYKVKLFFNFFISFFPPHATKVSIDWWSIWLAHERKLSLFCLCHWRELLRCGGGLCLNSAAGSSMSCWQPMNTSSRTSRYWPRWKRLKLCSICTELGCFSPPWSQPV